MNEMMKGMSSMMGTSMGWMCTMMVVWGLLLVAVIGVTVYIVARLLMKSRVDDRSLQLLKERYVKGEITEEEYQQKRKNLDKLS